VSLIAHSWNADWKVLALMNHLSVISSSLKRPAPPSRHGVTCLWHQCRTNCRHAIDSSQLRRRRDGGRTYVL